MCVVIYTIIVTLWVGNFKRFKYGALISMVYRSMKDAIYMYIILNEIFLNWNVIKIWSFFYFCHYVITAVNRTYVRNNKRKHVYTCNFIVYYNSMRLCNSIKCPWIVNYISMKSYFFFFFGFVCLLLYCECFDYYSLNFPRKYLWHTSFRNSHAHAQTYRCYFLFICQQCFVNFIR